MRVIDLTFTLSESFPMFPDSPPLQIIPWNEIKKDEFNLELVFLSTHSGTHLDAPFHFSQKGRKIHQISVDRLIRNSRLMEFNNFKKISKSDIKQYEKENGKILKNDSIILKTNWSKKIKSTNFFIDNPGLTESAAKYLALKKINMIAIDSPSIDVGKNKKYPAHKILSENDILIVENLCNLEKITLKNFQIVVMPIKLKNSSGSPVRVVAIQ